MNKPLLKTVIVALCLSLAGCGGGGEPSAPPLEGARIGGDFTLTNSSGQPVRFSDSNGKYRIVYFGYTYCPDVCPTDMQNIGQAMKMLEQSDPQMAERIVPMFVTIDPARDTPQVVGEFVSAFHPRIIGLTGNAEQIDAAAKAFVIYYKKGNVSEEGGYLMDHSNQAYLMGPAGQPIALLPTDESGEAVAAELKRWVR